MYGLKVAIFVLSIVNYVPYIIMFSLSVSIEYN